MLFFFQAEDGIRDYKVTGVQTCALPIYFVRRVKTLERLADQREILGVLERRILWWCEFTGCAGQGAKPQLPSAAAVPHLAIGRGATRGIDLPLPCRRLNQHGARRGSRLAQRLPEGTDGVGVTGDLDTENGVAV